MSRVQVPVLIIYSLLLRCKVHILYPVCSQITVNEPNGGSGYVRLVLRCRCYCVLNGSTESITLQTISVPFFLLSKCMS